MIAAVVGLHIWALHVPGNNNPLGIDVKGPQDTVPFHPYYTVKDAFYLSMFVIVYAVVVFYAPNILGNPDNYMPANPLVTPPDIVPDWYLLPFYAMLRSIPKKLIGVLVLFGAIITLVFIPWLDTWRVRSCALPPDVQAVLLDLRRSCMLLGYCGSQGVDAASPDLGLVWLARIATLYYYGFFWVLMPVLGIIETPKSFLPPSRHRCSAIKPRQPSKDQTCVYDSSLGTRGLRRRASGCHLGGHWTRPGLPPKDVQLSFDRPFGPYDRGAASARFPGLQGSLLGLSSASIAWPSTRSMNRVVQSFTEAQAKAIAAGYKIPADPNDKGDIFDDKAIA